MLWFQLQLQAGTPLNLPGDKSGTTPVASDPPPPKAGPLQVAATMFCGIFAIGAKGTWQKSGATVTFTQVVIGAAITLIVLITGLALLVKLAVR